MSNSINTRIRRRYADLCTECGNEPAQDTSDIGVKCTERMVNYTREWRKQNRLKYRGSSWRGRIRAAVAKKRKPA